MIVRLFNAGKIWWNASRLISLQTGDAHFIEFCMDDGREDRFNVSIRFFGREAGQRRDTEFERFTQWLVSGEQSNFIFAEREPVADDKPDSSVEVRK